MHRNTVNVTRFLFVLLMAACTTGVCQGGEMGAAQRETHPKRKREESRAIARANTSVDVWRPACLAILGREEKYQCDYYL